VPYIKKEDREVVDLALRHCIGWTLGQVAYAVYKIMREQMVPEKTFVRYAAIVGAVKLTLDRFVEQEVFAYEDQKQAENGDVA
jgi:hypothetical protein